MNARRVRDYEKGFKHGKIVAFSLCGFSTREIAQEVGITYSAVAKILRKKHRNALRLRIPLGRIRKTTQRADRLLLRLAKNNKLSSVPQLLHMWRERVSKSTIYRRLRQKGFRKYRLLRRPFLSRDNIAARLRWAQGKVLYRELQWDKIVWSDESRFCLNFCDGRARVWRERGKIDCTQIFWHTQFQVMVGQYMFGGPYGQLVEVNFKF
jgi:transposase